MFCSKCGKEIKEGAKFCIFCGNSVTQTPSVNKMENAAAAARVDSDKEDDKTLLLNEEENQIFTQNINPIQRPVQTAPPMIDLESAAAKQSKKRKGLGGLIILLICLVIIAGGCLFFIFFVEGDDTSSRATVKQSKEDDDDEDDGDGEKEATEEDVEDGEERMQDEAEGELETTQEAIDYMAKAQEAYEAADYTLAIQCCEMAIQEDAQNVEAYSTKALAFLKQNDCEQAANTLYEGIEATGSEKLKAEREQLIMDVTAVSCSQFNSLGVLICDVTYDGYGNAVQYTHYSDGTNISAIEEYSYDSLGRCTRMVQCDGNGNMQWQETYSYDSAGNMTNVTHYNSKMREEWTDCYSYDKEGREIELERYNSDGTLSWWDEYTYADDENMTKTAHPSDGSTVIIRCKLSFDAVGNQTGYEEYDSSGVCTYFWTKEYNGLDDEVVYLYGDSTVNSVYDYVYNP